jgi:hypothetical protein
MRSLHSTPPLNPSGPAVIPKSGVASEGMSSEKDKRDVLTVYEERCSACSRASGGCFALPDDEADKGSRASGMSSCDSRNADILSTRRDAEGSLKVTTPSTVSPSRNVVLIRVKTATISPSLAMSYDADH